MRDYCLRRLDWLTPSSTYVSYGKCGYEFVLYWKSTYPRRTEEASRSEAIDPVYGLQVNSCSASQSSPGAVSGGPPLAVSSPPSLP
jgi:hypothetical protein